MALSDFFPDMKGWTTVPAPQQATPAPQIPNDQTQVSGYLRATLPLPLQYSPDTLRQYNRPGLSSFRIAPLPPSGLPSVNSAAQSVAVTNIQSFVTVAAAGPNGAVQFNTGGALAGTNLFTYDFGSSTLSVKGTLTLTVPLGIVYGGTGTSTPALVAGGDITITGSWPNNTIAVATQGGVTPGSYTNPSLTVDSHGIITAISSGLGGTWNTVNKTTGYTAVAGDMALCDTTTGGFTVNLPLSTSNTGRSIRIKKISADANVVTISRTGGDLIDGQTTQIINFQYTDIEVTADGSGNWWIA